jgi:hypothetical protein
MNHIVLLSVFFLVAADALYAQDVQKAAEAVVAAQGKIAAETKTGQEAAKKSEEQKKSSAEVEKKDAQQKAEQAAAQAKSEEEKKKAEQAAEEAKKKAEEEKLEQAKKAALEKARQEKEHEEKLAQEKKLAEQKAAASKKPSATQEGIDTLELEGGNWLLKRQALEKTVDLIEQINGYFTKILEARIDFLVKRNKTDHDFDLFINKIGFEIGDLSRLLHDLVQKMEDERKALGDLTEDERAVLQELDQKIKEIKALQEETNNAVKLTSSLDDVIMQLEQEVTIANSYQTNAWKNFQAIKKVLNDEKAEELYLETQGLLKNIQAVDAYLKGKLLDYFNATVRNITQSTKKIEDTFQALSDKGVNFKDEIERFIESDKKRETVDKTLEQQIAKEAQKKAAARAKKAEQGWGAWFMGILYYPIELVQDMMRSIMSLFSGGNEVVVARRKTSAPQEATTASPQAVTKK